MKYHIEVKFNHRIVILILMILLSFHLIAQEKKLAYKVIHNGDLIGTLNIHQFSEGSFLHVWAESEVRSRFIILLILLAKEEVIFNNGVLVFSSVYRKLNGKEKTNIQIKLEGKTYQVNNKGSVEPLNSGPIYFNLLSMYVKEPKHYSKAYSDIFMKFVPIVKTGANQYTVTLPDGNYNNYLYKDDLCTKVEVHHSLFSIQFLLTSN